MFSIVLWILFGNDVELYGFSTIVIAFKSFTLPPKEVCIMLANLIWFFFLQISIKRLFIILMQKRCVELIISRWSCPLQMTFQAYEWVNLPCNMQQPLAIWSSTLKYCIKHSNFQVMIFIRQLFILNSNECNSRYDTQNWKCNWTN